MNHRYIEQKRNILEVKAYVEEIVKCYNPEEILCLFDIDQTILAPTHPAAKAPNLSKFLNLRLKYSDHVANFSYVSFF